MASRLRKYFPVALLRTRIGLAFMDKLAKRLRLERFGFLFMAVLPVLAGIAIYITLSSLVNILGNPAVSARVRELGPASNLLLPGVNPYLPLVYGWIALLLSMFVHEYAHGVMARSYDIPVNSIGIALILFIPVGAFVEVDEDELEKADLGKSLSVLSAGPGLNLITGIVALVILLLVTASLSPIVDGLLIAETVPGAPADRAGLRPGDIIIEVNGRKVYSAEGFSEIVEPIYVPGANLVLEVVRGGERFDYAFTLASNPANSSRGFMGITRIVPLKETLDRYTSAFMRFTTEEITIYLIPPTLPTSTSIVPFSEELSKYYTSNTFLGSNYSYLVNALFWIWFVNFNLGTFNAIPFRPLDGGVVMELASDRLLSPRIGRRKAKLFVRGLALLMAGLVFGTIVVPYLL